MSRPTLLAAACGLLFVCAAPADEIRLADGRVLVGAVKKKSGGLVVETRDGVVPIDESEVVARRTAAELRVELRRLAKASGDSPFHQLELARAALGYGLEKAMWKHLDRCVAAIQDGGGSQSLVRRSRAFLAELEPEVLAEKYRKQDTRGRVRGLVRTVRGSTGIARRAAVIELLVHEKDANDALRFCTRRETMPEQRLVAIEALVRRSPEQGLPDLCRSIVMDKEPDVRVATAELIRRYGDPLAAIRYLAPGFLHDHPSIRGRTAQAYGYLDDEAGAPYLVAAGPLAGVTRAAAGNIGVRAHMFQITTRAYIRDFEVEIAQAAAVANPVIGNAQNGVVLDVKVGGVTTMRASIVEAYRRALQRITGKDPGKNPALWRSWWLANRPNSSGVESGQGSKAK